MDREETLGVRPRSLGGDWIARERLAREIKRNLFGADVSVNPHHEGNRSPHGGDDHALEFTCSELDQPHPSHASMGNEFVTGEVAKCTSRC